MYLQIDRNLAEFNAMPLHQHKTTEIHFCAEGEGCFITPDEKVPLIPGMAVIIPPGITHRSVGNGAFFNICVRGEFSHLMLLNKPLLINDNPEKDGEHLARLLYRNRHSVDPFAEDLANAYLRFLLRRTKVPSATEEAVEKIHQELAEHALDRVFDLSALLQSTGYAEDYIRMLFKKHYGIPPLKYLAKLRMDHACFLIEVYQDSLSLAEIARQCGYDDYIYFSKTFKAQTGLSPREYLKK